MKIELTLKNRIEELERIKDAINSVAKSDGSPENSEFEMMLIAEELFTNTVYYGFPDNGEHEIKMDVAASHGEWEITMRDDGLPFDPTKAPEADTSAPLSEREIGGLGIHLIRNISNVFDYERKDDFNFVRVKKSVPN